MSKNQKKTYSGFECLANFKPIHKNKPDNAAPVDGYPANSTGEAQARANPVERLTRDEYDDKLKNEEPKNHNPNPFDFVFLSGAPKLLTPEDLEKGADLVSGCLTVKLKALTPLHIIGKQTPVRGRIGQKIDRSAFYLQEENPCIPGSSIRGMLRSFIETITNGWVSQAQEKYDNARDSRGTPKRHITFASFGHSEKPHAHSCIGDTKHKLDFMIPSSYKPDISKDVDIATYLFGMVDSSKGGESGDAPRAGKVVIEDALFSEDLLKKDCKMIDTAGTAFMGGPAPRANWWHMRPREVWERRVQGGSRIVAQIVGDGFWGRKFYYHQNPNKCLEQYKLSNGWSNTYEFNMECLNVNQTVSFRLDFHRLPKPLLQLLCACLCLPGKMRHKLGYGKAFGYGSVEFDITGAKWRVEKEADWPGTFTDGLTELKSSMSKGWDDESVKKYVAEQQALKELARILTWAPEDEIIFTYPPFDTSNFKKVIGYDLFTRQTGITVPTRAYIEPVTESVALNAAKRLWNDKKPVHFLLYQARAKGYKKIRERTP